MTDVHPYIPEARKKAYKQRKAGIRPGTPEYDAVAPEEFNSVLSFDLSELADSRSDIE